MSRRGSTPQAPSANQPPAQPPAKKKVRIRKGKRWVEVDVDSVVQKGRFKYIKFTDDDGLETYWISPE
jgi:hypothetical protein